MHALIYCHVHTDEDEHKQTLIGMHAHPCNLSHTATLMALVCHIHDRPNAWARQRYTQRLEAGTSFCTGPQSPLNPVRYPSGTESIMTTT